MQGVAPSPNLSGVQFVVPATRGLNKSSQASHSENQPTVTQAEMFKFKVSFQSFLHIWKEFRELNFETFGITWVNDKT